MIGTGMAGIAGQVVFRFVANIFLAPLSGDRRRDDLLPARRIGRTCRPGGARPRRRHPAGRRSRHGSGRDGLLGTPASPSVERLLARLTTAPCDDPGAFAGVVAICMPLCGLG